MPRKRTRSNMLRGEHAGLFTPPAESAILMPSSLGPSSSWWGVNKHASVAAFLIIWYGCHQNSRSRILPFVWTLGQKLFLRRLKLKNVVPPSLWSSAVVPPHRYHCRSELTIPRLAVLTTTEQHHTGAGFSRTAAYASTHTTCCLLGSRKTDKQRFPPLHPACPRPGTPASPFLGCEGCATATIRLRRISNGGSYRAAYHGSRTTLRTGRGC